MRLPISVNINLGSISHRLATIHQLQSDDDRQTTHRSIDDLTSKMI